MRGEYTAMPFLAVGRRGSSPHAWGIRRRVYRGAAEERFIPTCVGNTPQAQSERPQSAVHPHMRGEYGRSGHQATRAAGSSPHAWGIPPIRRTTGIKRRFIPTCVGNTAALLPAALPWPVHPHMRGEYACPKSRRHARGGSSPHAWGIHNLIESSHIGLRFIPTCVGNTRMGIWI